MAPRRPLAALLGLALSATALSFAAPSQAAPASPHRPPVVQTKGADAKAPRMHWTPRKAQYPGTVTRSDLPITMSDGVVLRGNLTLPADADGQAIGRRFPVIVTITAYNKSATSGTPIAGDSGDYLVRRGYARLVVDARGTGSSNGQWNAFDTRENKDSGEIMTWAHEQKWSNGKTAMAGPSYMGINQIWAAAAHPPGLKALFPQVPGADVYRDVVASGGAIDVGFIPLWLGLVTSTGLIPPAYGADDPQSAFSVLLDHIQGALGFTAQVVPASLLAQEPAYDGDFYQQRSNINVVNKVKVPAFFVSGEYDLFQRGTPLLFEALQKNHVPTKMIVGPWDHLQGSSGEGLDDAGYGTLSELQLRWFDHYVKGMPDPWLNRDIKALTYYEQGSGNWTHAGRWIGHDLQGVSYKLSGSATNLQGGDLGRARPATGSATVLPVPVSGLCTRSANQWTAGVVNSATSQLPTGNPCLQDNRVNDATGVVFDTAPMKRGVRLRGPIDARLYTSVQGAGDGMLSVSVEDVAPDGTVSRLTGGWQVLSLAKLQRKRSRMLDGTIIQPWHPFTKASQKPLEGTRPVDVEVFPTAAKIAKGHRLRIAVQAFDVPHLLPPLPTLVGSLSAITLHTGPETPSSLNVPVVTRH
ncbi:CocE/NonD family hydrolase [Nocardioides acrostichi]|uniref:CocE/NonD family hydrolase n=1 Tax=Nocardioides acrostichi TaxID=2784339 RepID=A0A930Y5I2_9ACTN|nr:CocE/NonD family hydrolase [Nocardioides acrostichi]MBF4161270.1 CocE/NonD family hydrolase [Nocardioides acrostichi]